MRRLLCRVLCIIVFLVLFVNCCHYEYEDISKHKNFKLLPNDECGESESDRIIGGSSASMGQFPFMARLGYSTHNCDDILEFKCGGALITKNHVITAAHCVSDLPKNYCECTHRFEQFHVTIVRLGEHNIKTNPDCDNDVCAPKVQDIGVEKIAIHPYYGKPRLRNDIAIIKLKTAAKFNGWVAPICLIYGKYTNKNYTGHKATVAGWGIFKLNTHETSDDLQALSVPIVDYKMCYISYNKITKVSHLQQLCAGGIKGQDSCSGDSGGPLFISDNTDEGPRYKAIGIVSFGFKQCAKRAIPAVYTNLLYYGRWMLDNLS